MKSKGVEILAAAVVLFVSVSPVMAVLVEFKDGGVHDITYEINTTVFVDNQSPGMGTTVNMLEGGRIPYDYSLVGFENSIINMSGGWIGWGLIAHDSSQINVSGGEIDNIGATDNSRVTVSGGKVSDVFAYDNSQVAVSGGWMNCLDATDSSQVTVSGGSIGGELRPWYNAVLTIDGSDFAVDGTPVGYIELSSILGGNYWDEPDRRLTGTLLNGDPLDNVFLIGHSARIVLVPEPATLLLLGFGGIMLRRRRQG